MKTEFPRTIPLAQDSVTSIDLPVFADASIADNCSPQIVAVVYTVVYQPNFVSQFLVTNKSRISNHNITIPRPELVSTSMGANLVTEWKSSIRKSKHEISLRLYRQHSSTVLAKQERKLQTVCC